jgi:hypothetical protein
VTRVGENGAPTVTKSACSVCGQGVYRDGQGRVLMHTVKMAGSPSAQVCPGSVRGARP